MGTVYEEECLSQKNVYKWVKHGFTSMSNNNKKQCMEWRHTEFQIEKNLLGTVVRKEGHVDSL